VQLHLSYRDAPVRTPVSPGVHKAPVGTYWAQARVFEPPFPGRVAGKGYPVWTLSHRGRELVFASPEEMAHAAEVLGQRVMPRPWQLSGPAYGRANQHWLSRLHQSWRPWEVRQEMVKKLRAALV